MSKSERCKEIMAYRWWNSQVSNIKDKDLPPEVVLPSEAHDIWVKICPFFLLFVIDESNIRNYWESIQAIVSMLVPDQIAVPNPISHFPEFIEIVYFYQNILIPKNVECCIYFINKFGFHDVAHFFLYQSPVFLTHPLLYMETLLELCKTRHFIWNEFVQNPYLVDAFFDMYLSFFLPVPDGENKEIYEHRILISEVCFSLIKDSCDHHPNASSLITRFLDSAVDVVSSSSCESVFPVFRVIFLLFSLAESKKIYAKAEISNYSLRLFESSTKLRSMYLIYKFLYNKQYLSSIQILNIIAKRGIFSLSDFNILMEITDQETAVPLLMFLLKTAITNRTWHRTCFSLIRRCISKFSANRSDVKELMKVVIRRLFLWISFASMKRKYSGRALMLCESLVLLYESKVGWIQQIILSSAYSIISASKSSPIYFRSFFPVGGGASVDDALLQEWDLFLPSVKLKTFPFDAATGMLIMPPAKDFSRNNFLRSISVSPSVQNPVQNSGLKYFNGSSKKIKVHILDSKRTTTSSLSIRPQLSLGQIDAFPIIKRKGKTKNALENSYFDPTKISSSAKKGSTNIIKRPDSSIVTVKSQLDIKIHSKRKDDLLS